MPIYKYYTAQGCLAQGFTVLPYFVKKVFSMSGKVLNSLLAVAQRSMEKLKVG